MWCFVIQTFLHNNFICWKQSNRNKTWLFASWWVFWKAAQIKQNGSLSFSMAQIFFDVNASKLGLIQAISNQKFNKISWDSFSPFSNIPQGNYPWCTILVTKCLSIVLIGKHHNKKMTTASGVEYLVFVSSRSLKTREKYKLSEFVYFSLVLREREETKTKYSAPLSSVIRCVRLNIPRY